MIPKPVLDIFVVDIPQDPSPMNWLPRHCALHKFYLPRRHVHHVSRVNRLPDLHTAPRLKPIAQSFNSQGYHKFHCPLARNPHTTPWQSPRNSNSNPRARNRAWQLSAHCKMLSIQTLPLSIPSIKVPKTHTVAELPIVHSWSSLNSQFKNEFSQNVRAKLPFLLLALDALIVLWTRANYQCKGQSPFLSAPSFY